MGSFPPTGLAARLGLRRAGYRRRHFGWLQSDDALRHARLILDAIAAALA